MTTQRDKLREDVQFRILRLLQDNPKMSQRELAKAVGLSTGGIHYVLSALLAKGLLKIENSTTAEDKRRYAYVLTRRGLATKADLTTRFLVRKMADYELLKAEIDEVIDEVCEDLSDTEMAELKTVLKDCLNESDLRL
jgi:EPS-associated MarR family transcriptional regulator